MGLNNKKNNVVSGIQERIITLEWGDVEARIAETLLNEPKETEAEIAELEAITDEDESNTKKPEIDFSLKDGPMKNLHINHINKQ